MSGLIQALYLDFNLFNYILIGTKSIPDVKSTSGFDWKSIKIMAPGLEKLAVFCLSFRNKIYLVKYDFAVRFCQKSHPDSNSYFVEDKDLGRYI